MVASASSSNTQWPSGCWQPSSACVARSMRRSRASGAVSSVVAVMSFIAPSRSSRRRGRRHGCRTGSHLRSSPAGRSRSSRRQEPDCPTPSARPAAWRSPPASPRRSRAARARSATAAGRPETPVTAHTSGQIVCASAARGVGHEPVRTLIVTDSRPGNAKIHSVVPLITPVSRRQAGRRFEAEMRVDDGAELGRPLSPGTSVAAA